MSKSVKLILMVVLLALLFHPAKLYMPETC